MYKKGENDIYLYVLIFTQRNPGIGGERRVEVEEGIRWINGSRKKYNKNQLLKQKQTEKKPGGTKKKVKKVLTYMYIGIDDNGEDAKEIFHCISYIHNFSTV